jgi:hypothetical protein
VTEERPAPDGGEPPSEPTAERTPSWPRRAAKVAADAAWDDLSDTSRRLAQTGRHRLRHAWDRRPSRGALAAWAFLAVAALAGAVSLAAQIGLPSRLPSDLDWRAAAALLERDAKPGDAVVLAPAWAERAREELPARLPVLALDRYAREPLLGVRRAWLLSLAGAPWADDAIAREIAARASADGGTQRLGALDLTRYDLAQPARAIAFLPDWIGQAQARLGERPCDREGPLALRCGGPAPLRIAREVRDVGGAPRPCVSSPPGSPDDGPVSVTFPAVPMGLLLRGGAGVVGRLPAPGAPPIRVAVQVDGAEVSALELPGGAPGWSAFEVRTTALAAEPHAVTFVLSSADPAGRTVCFDAWTQP